MRSVIIYKSEYYDIMELIKNKPITQEIEVKTMNRCEDGAIFTIFGGTGNLSYYKLMPAFYQLHQEGRFKKRMAIVAIGRREKTTKDYIEEVEVAIKQKSKTYTKESFDDFKDHIYYYEMDFADDEHYPAFEKYMSELDTAIEACGNRVFYLATLPNFFPTISKQLKTYGLLETRGYRRAVFEKPFGYDYTSAKKINEGISEVFGESNIYRIDHYLGKEMIQNIHMIRLSNQIFKGVWNKHSIDNVQITVKEDMGVGDRGGYYDQSGALRDMIQNHLIQILALVAMEPPADLDTESIRQEKVKVLKHIAINKEEVIFGQYRGYTEEEKVPSDSLTETFVGLKAHVNTERFQGVPFYLRTGKYLDTREAEVIVEFKNDSVYKNLEASMESNLLVIKIQPEEGIYFRINTKQPRSENRLMPVSMDYCQSCNIVYKSPEAYERLLLDITLGDRTLFTSWEEIEHAWRIVDKLMAGIENKRDYIFTYEPKTDGPSEVHELLEKEGRVWWCLSALTATYFQDLEVEDEH
jgi:glucose-6-phosphate 1-dehydrogenase